jgi:hypothetical protein
MAGINEINFDFYRLNRHSYRNWAVTLAAIFDNRSSCLLTVENICFWPVAQLRACYFPPLTSSAFRLETVIDAARRVRVAFERTQQRFDARGRKRPMVDNKIQANRGNFNWVCVRLGR